ncbi:MAG TPA: glycoside hydrolase family 28 protein [Phnomibacter sp.]|nr:glycoside hydrolase family 28 protein [Phnomibacter sp.]
MKVFRRNGRLFMMALLIVLAGMQTAAFAQGYTTLKIKAPFRMDSVRLYSYPQKDFIITSYGAVEGGKVKNTEAIANAIAACHEAGGGRVVIPAGTWLTGPIHFKSNVNLYLQENAVVKFTDDPRDYLPAVQTSWEGLECFNYSPLIYAFECENIAITGTGTLAPIMDHWREWFPRPAPHMEALKKLNEMAATGVPVEKRQMAEGENNLRPHLIQLNRCKTILLDSFKVKESPFWAIHILLSNGGVARNLDVEAHGHNNDGIDLESTRNFLVENCLFNQGDDAVVIKSGSNQDGWRLNAPAENIVVRNCRIKAGYTLLGIGSELSGGIRNIYMHDCVAPVTVHRLLFIKTNHRRGAFVENIYMENITTGGALSVLEIDTDVLYQWRTLVPTYETRITRIANINMKNIQCDAVNMIYDLKGDERLPINNVNLKNVHVNTVANAGNTLKHTNNLSLKKVKYDKVDPNAVSELNKYLNNK